MATTGTWESAQLRQTDMMNHPFGLLGLAQGVLRRLRSTLDDGVHALARQCSPAGRLDADLLDARQVASFELAWAAAELLAAETAVRTAGHGPGAHDDALRVPLALLYTLEAVASVLERLETVYAEAELGTQTLRALRDDPGWAQLRAEAGRARHWEAAGRLVAQSDADTGGLPLDEAHALARASFRRFAQEVVAPQAQAIHRHDLTVPETLLQPLREMGVFGLAIPQRLGGSAPDDHDDTLLMVVVTEALSEGSLAAAGSLITRPEILSRALLAGGTPAQQAHWLPRIAAGEPLCAIAITEPDHGSDAASLSLRATPVAGGWLLDGAKTWCTFAGKAGLLMVVARTHPDRSLGHRGLSVLLVEKPSFDTHDFVCTQERGGRLAGRAIPTIGYRGMHSFDLAFEGWFVPDSHVVGGQAGLGRGFYLTMTGMVGGRMQTAARACGVMRAALRGAIAHANTRQVFGRPLAEFALTQAKLARLAARLAACRTLTYRVAQVVDEGDGRVEASLVKLLACRFAEQVTREALQLHGGIGYAEESAASRHFVDARVLSIFEGAEETLALKVVARGLMERALAAAEARHPATPARSVAAGG